MIFNFVIKSLKLIQFNSIQFAPLFIIFSVATNSLATNEFMANVVEQLNKKPNTEEWNPLNKHDAQKLEALKNSPSTLKNFNSKNTQTPIFIKDEKENSPLESTKPQRKTKKRGSIPRPVNHEHKTAVELLKSVYEKKQ